MDRLIALCHRRWSVPVLAELDRAGGAKFVTLAHRLAAGATAVRQTLDELIERGWVRRNPGYGHPLRPEYILTRAGQRLAPHCATLHATLENHQLLDVGLKKWSMPVLFAIGERIVRFSHVVERVGDITDRALALALKDLTSGDLVSRRVLESFPPIPAYSATGSGRLLVPILERFC